MRWIYVAIIVLFFAVVIVFGLQNLETVKLDFLGFSISAPLAFAIFAIYVLGAATGGSLLALLRRSYKGSRRPSA